MTDFLYPFIDADERDAGPLLADLAASARDKQTVSTRLTQKTLERNAPALRAIASEMADRLVRDARVFVFGNGGSSTDAVSLAALFATPPWGRPLASRNLVDDSAVLTALGNDVGFDLIFSRQLIAHGHPNDVAIGFSTSGNSSNLLRAFAEASGRGLLTVGLAGYSGGEMAGSPHVKHCLVVDADSVHRIQEAQAALGFALWEAVQARLSNPHEPLTLTSPSSISQPRE